MNRRAVSTRAAASRTARPDSTRQRPQVERGKTANGQCASKQAGKGQQAGRAAHGGQFNRHGWRGFAQCDDSKSRWPSIRCSEPGLHRMIKEGRVDALAEQRLGRHHQSACSSNTQISAQLPTDRWPPGTPRICAGFHELIERSASGTPFHAPISGSAAAAVRHRMPGCGFHRMAPVFSFSSTRCVVGAQGVMEPSRSASGWHRGRADRATAGTSANLNEADEIVFRTGGRGWRPPSQLIASPCALAARTIAMAVTRGQAHHMDAGAGFARQLAKWWPARPLSAAQGYRANRGASRRHRHVPRPRVPATYPAAATTG